MQARTKIIHLTVVALPLCLFLAGGGNQARGAAAKTGPVITTLHSFGNAGDGAQPHDSPVAGPGGVLYGTTYSGGTFGLGTVYSLTPPAVAGGAWTEAVLYSFGAVGDASSPTSGVAIGPKGGLYGTTFQGGANDRGAVFLLTPPIAPGGPWTESLLWSFGSPGDGAGPIAGVVGAGGMLYGTTLAGGSSNKGTVFALTAPSSPGMPWTEAVLHSFTGASDGSSPSSGVVIATGGVLFGVTDQGGANNMGTAYSLTPPIAPGSPWTEAILYTFHGNDGYYPSGGLLMSSTGVLYGMADGEGGVGGVFSLTPPLYTHAIIRTFRAKQGSQPDSLALGPRGSLVGTTYQGGKQNLGTVFQMKPPKAGGSAWSIANLGSFVSGAASGELPTGLTPAIRGVYYGTTTGGGAYKGGTLFSVTP